MVKNKTIRNLFIAFIFLTMVWLIIQTTWENLPKSINVTDVSVPPMGGMCGRTLYDHDGIGYDNYGSYVDYSGPAPLFDVPYQALGLTPNPMTICVEYPKKIDPLIAQAGQPVYPILIFTEFEADTLRTGESYPLRIRAILSSYFPPGAKWNAYMPLDKVTDVMFTIDAPNFEFSPANDEARNVPFGYSFPAENTWSIAPVERASGEQFLAVFMYSEEVDLTVNAEIKLVVRNALGLNPSIVAYLSSIGLVIGYILSQTKTFIEIMDSFGKQKKKKEK